MGEYADFGYEGNGDATDVLRWALERYQDKIALACSFQHTVLLHMLTQIRADARVFAIDTGRLNEETYACAAAAEERLGVKIEWYFPRTEGVENLVRSKGVYSFRANVDARRECCFVRKVEPLSRALAGLDAWITGLRRDQGESRREVALIEKDEAHGGIIKINPLAAWESTDVRDYSARYELPYNKLLDQGYASVGCAPCTRRIAAGEQARAGRWWWEESEHKECGLHVRNWNI